MFNYKKSYFERLNFKKILSVKFCIQDLLENKTNYFCMQMPEHKVDKIYISFSILKFILIEIFNNNFKLSYYLALIKIVKPKMIMTWIDNDIRFFKLAKILTSKNFSLIHTKNTFNEIGLDSSIQ